MITITETLYKKMPEDIKACFNQLPNPPSEEVRECFPETKSGKAGKNGHKRKESLNYESNVNYADRSKNAGELYGDSGNASRFFKSIIYTAKASKAERNRGLEGMEAKQSNMRVNAPRANEEAKHANKMQNFHPTVKPVALMEYLVNMFTKEGQTVLDPFMGSGTTGVACKNLNRNFIGIERDPEYCKIAEARINY